MVSIHFTLVVMEVVEMIAEVVRLLLLLLLLPVIVFEFLLINKSMKHITSFLRLKTAISTNLHAVFLLLEVAF